LDPNALHGTYSNHLTFYGGQTVTGTINWKGRIQGSITEATPEGTKHQSGKNSLPAPYIGRVFSMIDGVAMIDTPMIELPTEDDTWHITEGTFDPRFRERTSFDTTSEEAYIHNGTLYSNGADRTVKVPVFEVPKDIAEQRLQTLLRALAVAAAMCDEVASPINRTVTWEVTESRS
jgi:hypothetical protein